VEIPDVEAVRRSDHSTLEEDVEDRVRVEVVRAVTNNAHVVPGAGSEKLLEEGRAWKLLDLDGNPDRPEVALDGLGLGDVYRGVLDVENGLATSRVTSGEGLRPFEVWVVKRVDVRVHEPGHARRQVLVGERTRPFAPLTEERRPIEGEVDRLPERCVVLEQRLRRVEDDVPDADP